MYPKKYTVKTRTGFEILNTHFELELFEKIVSFITHK